MDSLHALERRFGGMARGDAVRLTTRYRPRREAELKDGSLFWIIRHMLVARSQLLGFEEADEGRANILVSPVLVRVEPRPRRAHQGWRYLEAADAPGDSAGDSEEEELPPALRDALVGLGLV